MTLAQRKAVDVWDKEKKMVRDIFESVPAINVAGAYIKNGISDFEKKKYGNVEKALSSLVGDMSEGLRPGNYWAKVYDIVVHGYQLVWIKISEIIVKSRASRSEYII